MLKTVYPFMNGISRSVPSPFSFVSVLVILLAYTASEPCSLLRTWLPVTQAAQADAFSGAEAWGNPGGRGSYTLARRVGQRPFAAGRDFLDGAPLRFGELRYALVSDGGMFRHVVTEFIA